MHPAVNDIESLLAASRELLSAEELEFERLLAWSAERNGIFARFKSRDLSRAADDSSAVAALMRELLSVDTKICARVSENQHTPWRANHRGKKAEAGVGGAGRVSFIPIAAAPCLGRNSFHLVVAVAGLKLKV